MKNDIKSKTLDKKRSLKIIIIIADILLIILSILVLLKKINFIFLLIPLFIIIVGQRVLKSYDSILYEDNKKTKKKS